MIVTRCGNVPDCGRELLPGQKLARGFCCGCYERARKAGFPETGPPPGRRSTEAANAAKTAAAAARRGRAAELAARGRALPVIANALGVTVDTVRVYLRTAQKEQKVNIDTAMTALEAPNARAPEPGEAPIEPPRDITRALEDGETDAITRAIQQQRARDAAVLNGVAMRGAA